MQYAVRIVGSEALVVRTNKSAYSDQLSDEGDREQKDQKREL